jgi:hypothetical protein
VAEGVGFEPTSRYNRETVFKTVTIVHSVTPPFIQNEANLALDKLFVKFS